MRTENWLDDWALFVAVVVAPPLMLTFLEDCDERAHLNVTRGGVFLGYSDVGDGPERWKMSGWELGFPITASVKGEGSPLWIRAEPRYLLTPDGPNVMMDIGLWADLPNGPVMMGVTGTMTRREPDPFVVGLTIGRRIGPAD